MDLKKKTNKEFLFENTDILKSKIRKEICTKRNQLSNSEWEEKTKYIYEKVVSHPFFIQADEIYCYIDYKNEVGTRTIIEKAWELKKAVGVPKIIGGEMQFFYINNFSEVEKGYCNILEPTTNLLAKPFPEQRTVLIIMPGVGFDRERNRIGYGKGYYDRYLDKYSFCHTLAIAFELQVVENIPVGAYDKKPEVIITEENIYV